MSDPITIDPIPVAADALGDFAVTGNAAVPHLSQWFGWWHYEPQRAAALYDQLRKVDVVGHVREWRQANVDSPNDPAPKLTYDDVGLTVNGGIAIIELSGSLMKHTSSMDDGTSTVRARRLVRLAKSDASVKAAIVVVDSPGGTVSGAYDLADDIKALASAKPVYGYAADLACSAGYLQLAMCRQISANRTALVGCIGTFGVMYDYSEMFKADGVKPIVISSGGFKGAGVPGTKITDEQVSEWQREIDALNEAFIVAVMDGRKMPRSQAAVLADGRTHVAEEARKLGLIDRVESLDSLVARVRREIGPQQQNQPAPVPEGGDNTGGPLSEAASGEPASGRKAAVERVLQESNEPPAAAEAAGDNPEPSAVPPAHSQEADMADPVNPPAQANEPKPASIKDLRAQFADDPDFALEAAENGWTMQEAKAQHYDRQQAEKARQKKDDEGKPKGRIGNQPINSRQESGDKDRRAGGGDAVSEFNDAVTAQMSKPGYEHDRKKATSAVMKRDPELHRAYLEANNPKRKQRALIADKFDGDE